MFVFAIDPGDTESGYCLYDAETKRPFAYGKVANHALIDVAGTQVSLYGTDLTFVIETMSIPKKCGKTVFDAIFWSGRFYQAMIDSDAVVATLMRITAKGHILKLIGGNDREMKEALEIRFGGKAAAIGTKAKPGPLYGMGNDCRAALAVAITFAETRMAPR